MTRYARIELLMLPREIPNSNDRGHWSITAKKRARMRNLAGNLALAERATTGAIQTPVRLDVTFDFPTKHRRDLDNVEIKGAIDGLVDGGLIPDDNARNIIAITRIHGGSMVPKGHVRMTFELMSVEPKKGARV